MSFSEQVYFSLSGAMFSDKSDVQRWGMVVDGIPEMDRQGKRSQRRLSQLPHLPAQKGGCISQLHWTHNLGVRFQITSNADSSEGLVPSWNLCNTKALNLQAKKWPLRLNIPTRCKLYQISAAFANPVQGNILLGKKSLWDLPPMAR